MVCLFFCLKGSAKDDILLAVECMDKLIRKRRQISLQRVLAFVKRLSTICLQLLPGACLAVMATIRAFMQVYVCRYSLSLFSDTFVCSVLMCISSSMLLGNVDMFTLSKRLFRQCKQHCLIANMVYFFEMCYCRCSLFPP